MDVLSEKMGIRHQVFGVKCPFFHLLHPFIFSGEMTNPITNLLREKKVGVIHEKMGISTQKLKNKVFGVKCSFFHLQRPFILSEEMTNTQCAYVIWRNWDVRSRMRKLKTPCFQHLKTHVPNLMASRGVKIKSF